MQFLYTGGEVSVMADDLGALFDRPVGRCDGCRIRVRCRAARAGEAGSVGLACWSCRDGGVHRLAIAAVSLGQNGDGPPVLFQILINVLSGIAGIPDDDARSVAVVFCRSPNAHAVPSPRALATFGRVPMFYYLLHIPLIHALALARGGFGTARRTAVGLRRRLTYRSRPSSDGVCRFSIPSLQWR